MAFHVLWLAAAVLAVDQLSKALILRRAPAGRRIRAGPFLQLRPVLNARGGGRRRRLFVMYAFVLCAVGLVAASGLLFQRDLARAGLGLAIGGATGNLTDHVRRGAIVDFLDLTWWPVFNLADVAIVFGTTLALWFIV